MLEAAGAAADAEDDLTDALAAAVHAAATTLAGHAALQRLLAEEPGAILPFISFDRLGPLLAQAAVWGREHLRRFLPDDEAEIAGEWVARVVLVHLRSPGSPTDTTDLAAVRRSSSGTCSPASPRSPTPDPSPRLPPDPRSPAPCRPPKTSSAASTSTTSTRSSPSPTPTSDATIHAVQDNADAIFTWDYEKGARPALNKLYEKAKTSQWNGETDLDWSIEVDQEAVVAANAIANGRGNVDFSGTFLGKWDDDRLDPVRHASPRTGCSPSSCTASRAR